MASKLKKLKNSYKEMLLKRNLNNNSRVESIRELAQLLECSTGTALKIVKCLTDEGILFSVYGKGNFFRKQPEKKFRIGCACMMPGPMLDPLCNEALEDLLDFLESAPHTETLIVQHRALLKLESAEKVLKNLDGLIVHSSFLDPVSIIALRRFSGPIVLIDSVGIEEKQILCSQVIPDFSTALEDFLDNVDITRYKKIVFLKPCYTDAEDTAKQVINFFSMHQLQIPYEMEKLPNGGCEFNMLWGYNFARTLSAEKDADTLFIALSGYIAKGMYEYFLKSGFIPDILSIDNLEAHGKNAGEAAFFTAIDRSMSRCYVEGAKLLLNKLESGDDCRSVLRIPTEIVFRKSIKHTNQIPSSTKMEVEK